jgi:hypothetical protein
METLSRTELYYGRRDSLRRDVELRAGPLSMDFDPETGSLHRIRLGEQEILRGIYGAVRDKNWGTVPPSLSNLRMEIQGQAFHLSFLVECKRRQINFLWRGVISGDAQGTVHFRMEGEALSTFLSNRIGLCALYSIRECAGQPLHVERVDGTTEKEEFPLYISPHHPVRSIRAISHEVVPGLSAEVRFEGAVFEMEDQRNWTDASFKIYSMPLDLPFPVEVKQGARVVQSITLALGGKSIPQAAVAQPKASLVVISLDQCQPSPLPRIGLGLSGQEPSLSVTDRERLKALNLSHLRVDLALSGPDWTGVFGRAVAHARALETPLEAALFLSDSGEQELANLAEELHRIGPWIATWLVFHEREKSTSERWVRLARRHLASYAPRASIGAGSYANFAELNREHPPIDVLDLVCYPVNPQMHTFSNDTLAETLEVQGSTVRNARRFVAGRPLAVTPVTLKPPPRPGVRGTRPEVEHGELPSGVDVRQMSLFGACWTLGSLKYLAEAGVHSVTYYETTGWKGVMQGEQTPHAPGPFPDVAGAVFPMYHALADAGEFAGGEVAPSHSSAPLRVEGLVLREGTRIRVLLMNLTGEVQCVRLAVAAFGRRVRVRNLDESNAGQAMRDPETYRKERGCLMETRAGCVELGLLPYAVARVDSVEEN